jgi:hypothetical protein
LLQNAAGIKEPTAEEVLKLHAKATVLSDRLTKENVHVLNDKNLMREALGFSITNRIAAFTSVL